MKCFEVKIPVRGIARVVVSAESSEAAVEDAVRILKQEIGEETSHFVEITSMEDSVLEVGPA